MISIPFRSIQQETCLSWGRDARNSIENHSKYINLKIKAKKTPLQNKSLRDPSKCDSPLLSNRNKETYQKLKKIVQESLTGLNNEKIIQKLDKIRDCVAKEKGVIISSKSLAECLSHSIVFPKQGSIKIAPKPFCEIETVEVNDKLTSKIERINSIPFTNEQFSSIEMNSSKLKFQRYQTSRGVNSEVEQEFNTENNMCKPKIMKKLPTFATTLSNLKNQIN